VLAGRSVADTKYPSGRVPADLSGSGAVLEVEMSNDDRAGERHDHEAAILLYAELIAEAQALGGALLDHDADEARFRAALIAGLARSNDLSGIALLADDQERRLTQRRDRPGVGVGASYERLSRALDHLLI